MYKRTTYKNYNWKNKKRKESRKNIKGRNRKCRKCGLEGLNTKILGHKLIYFEKLDSTQKEIYRKIEKNEIENGTIILAEIQTDGIGTHGRKWYKEESDNIAFSIYIKTDCEIKNVEGLSLLIAEILVKIIFNLYNIKLEIKKPNDIVYKGKKIGGILTETKSKGFSIKYLVIGIGLNTNSKPSNKEIADIVTSIKQEFNIDIDNLKIITEFCNLFEKELLERKIID